MTFSFCTGGCSLKKVWENHEIARGFACHTRNSMVLAVALFIIGAAQATRTVYKNAKIYRSDTRTFVDTLVVDDSTGKIVGLGREQDVGSVNDTAVRDLGGKLLLPGFHDVHLHAVEAGVNGLICFVVDDTPVEDLAYTLLDCPDSAQFGGQGWAVGAGIDIGSLLATLDEDVDAPLPIDVLDEAFPTTPVLILDSIGHGAVVNTEALKRVGLADGNSPAGGTVLSLEDGTLVGIVTENTQQLFRDAAFPPTPANQETAYESLLDALDTLRRNGITSVSDAGGFWRQAQTESWKRALENGMLTTKASNALYIYPDKPIDEQLSNLTARYSNDKTSRLRFNQAKIYVDGILELTTAALYDPYLDSAGLSEDEQLGFEYFQSRDKLIATAATLVANGFQLFFHVIGDRAAGIALDAIAALETNDHGPHRLTHCYLADERDRGRFVTLGANADFQIATSTLEPDYVDFLTSLIIGDTRAKALQPIKAIHDTGALVTLSSDWDADTLSPFVKIQTGIDLLSDIHVVLDMLTINGAKVLQQDSRTGSLEVGKDADFIVLDLDIFTVPSSDIDKTQVVLTVLEGKVVFDLDRDGPAVEISGCVFQQLLPAMVSALLMVLLLR